MIKRYLPFLLLVITGCKSPVSKEELYQYIADPENGLIHKTEIQGTSLELMYRPKDIVIAQEVGSEFERWDEVAKQLDSLDYFVLKLSRRDQEIENSLAGDPDRFTMAVSYLSNDISQDITITVDGESLPVEALMYAPTFGTAKGSSILLVFKSALLKRGEDFSIAFTDSMFGTGRNEFEFQVSDLEKTPPLKRL